MYETTGHPFKEKKISVMYSISAPSLRSAPLEFFFKKHSYFVSVIALLEYMYNEINCGSSSFYCLHVTSRQKQWPSSQSLNYYVHMSEQFLQRNELFSTLAWLFVLTRKDVGATSPFTIFFFFSFSNKNQSFSFHILLVLKKTISALSLTTALFQISTLP